MIEFKVSRIDEGDKSWEELIVKTPDKDWHSADLEYGTEDESKILEILKNKTLD